MAARYNVGEACRSARDGCRDQRGQAFAQWLDSRTSGNPVTLRQKHRIVVAEPDLALSVLRKRSMNPVLADGR